VIVEVLRLSFGDKSGMERVECRKILEWRKGKEDEMFSALVSQVLSTITHLKAN
jgi:hypothetical protein